MFFKAAITSLFSILCSCVSFKSINLNHGSRYDFKLLVVYICCYPMNHSLSSSSIISLKSPGSDSSSVCSNSFKCFSGSGHKVGSSGMENNKAKILVGDNGYVLEDVPHFSDYIPNLPVGPKFHSFDEFPPKD